MLENLVDHLKDLSDNYYQDSEMHLREGRSEDSAYWSGKSFAMSYAAFLVEMEIEKNA